MFIKLHMNSISAVNSDVVFADIFFYSLQFKLICATVTVTHCVQTSFVSNENFFSVSLSVDSDVQPLCSGSVSLGDNVGY